MDMYYVFGNGYSWCTKSIFSLIKRRNAFYIEDFFTLIPRMTFLDKICLYDKLSNSYLPFRILTYKKIETALDLNDNQNICFIIYDKNKLGNQHWFFDYLRRKYSNISFVYVFTNICNITRASGLGYLDKLNDWYDVVFAFDPEDAKKYGFSYSPLIYDADPNYKREEKESKEDLVFYVGQAKDRLPGLLSCFEKLKQLGIKTDFHIANVKEEDIKYSDEIIYNKFMTYAECVDSIQKATCLIDVIQGESTGLTIKTCEAVCYDKKLITTNKHVVEYPFYDPRYIRVVESPDDIDESFFTENKDVHYSEEGKRYFSADSFLERLHNELENRES